MFQFESTSQLHRKLLGGLSPRFAAAIAWLDQIEEEWPLGRTVIDGDDVSAEVSEYPTRTPQEAHMEAHRNYADIQCLLSGEEAIYVSPLTGLHAHSAYDPARDVGFFFLPQDKSTLLLRPGNCVALFPEDAHAPMIATGEQMTVKKCVIKVRV